MGIASDFVPVPRHTHCIFPTAIALPRRASVALLPSYICCFIKQMLHFFMLAGIVPPF